MRSPLRILYLEDNPTDADLLASTLRVKKFPCTVMAVATRPEFESAIERCEIDVILSDYSLPNFSGMAALQIAKQKCPQIPFIFVTGAIGEELAIETLKSGATDYVLKDRLSRLIPAITRAVAEVESRQKQQQTEEALKTSERTLRLLAENMRDVVFSYDTHRHLRYVNPAIENLTGFSVQECFDQPELDYVHPDDRHRVIESKEAAYCGTRSPDIEYRIVTKGGQTKWVSGRWSPLFDEAGTSIGVQGRESEITDRKLEEKKRQEIVNRKIAVLLKEIHHRVKNNLQVISSLLNLQAGYTTDPQSLEILRESQARIKSMALIHEKLYQSEDLHRIQFAAYIRSLVSSLFSSYQIKPTDVKLTLDVQNLLLDLDLAIPCGLIVNELFTNALKHAFPTSRECPENRPPEIFVGFSRTEPSRMLLTVRDNGIGMPKEIVAGQSTSLGMRLVRILADQIGAMVDVKTEAGTSWEITFAAGDRATV